MSKRIVAVDLFCGAGGTSTGVALAAEALGLKLDLVAVNHWQTAVDTHSANHPWAEHRCSTLEGLEPWQVLGGRKVDLLVASPECTHHSSARGGVPMSDQSRASAWHVVRWVEALRPRAVLIENVPEFASWGPLGTNGRPLKRQAGTTFAAWIGAMRSLGYAVEQRILNAADYGDATTRRRLFIVAIRGKGPSPFPEPTHAKDAGAPSLFGRARMPWRAAREIIDWSLAGRSIFGRDRPLAESTLRRIAEGIRRFGGAHAEPFLALLRGTGMVRDLDAPVPSITASGEHLALVEPQPFILGQQSGSVPRSVSEPCMTLSAKGAVSFIVPRHGERPGQAPRTHDVDAPMPVIPATNQHGVAQAFLTHVTHGGRVRSIEDPTPTITTAQRGELALAQPFIVPQSNDNGPRSADNPLGTVTTTSRGVKLVEPLLVPYNGTGRARDCGGPVPTLTTKDRFALVEGQALDITLRMLQPHELSAAMSFPKDYRFKGTKGDVVRQIGNAVPVGVARALAGAILDRLVGATS